MTTQHHPWCETRECIIESDYVTHLGPMVGPHLDVADTYRNGELWRNSPAEQEIVARLIDLGGATGVEVIACLETPHNSSGSLGTSWLTPREARELGAALLTVAAQAEAAGA